jgi:hypothetical protein
MASNMVGLLSLIPLVLKAQRRKNMRRSEVKGRFLCRGEPSFNGMWDWNCLDFAL